MTVRAKFFCLSMESASTGPTPVMRWEGNAQLPTEDTTWPRTYRFSAQYDPSIPEDVRYAKASPTGSLQIQVDNPAVVFEPGKSYYLDFTEVTAA